MAEHSGSSSDSSWVMTPGSRSAPPPTLEDIESAFAEPAAPLSTGPTRVLMDDGIRVRGMDADEQEREDTPDLHFNPFASAARSREGFGDGASASIGSEPAAARRDDVNDGPVHMGRTRTWDHRPATATVVETVQDLPDDAVARKILEEELTRSGRTLGEYLVEEAIQLERAASFRMGVAAEETKDEDDRKPAAISDESATVLSIAEYDVHPADFVSTEAQAEFIREDYSLPTADPPVTVATTEAAVATIDGQESDTEEATVLDSKPAARSFPLDWTERVNNEARVLETSPLLSQSWVERERAMVNEVAVDGLVEEEASVVGITEQDVHPADTTENEVQATLIGEDFSRTVTFSDAVSPPAPVGLERAASAPEMGDSTTATHSVWMSQPPLVELAGEGQPIVMPPPTTTGVAVPTMEGDTLHVSTPLAHVERLHESPSVEHDDQPTPIPPIPVARLGGRREASNTSSRSHDSARSDDCSGRRETSSGGSSHSSMRGNGLHTVSTMASRNSNPVIERLFGDGRRQLHGVDDETAAGSILPRTLLPWSVFRNDTTGMWVATVNTNQKALDSNNVEAASKALRAFSLQSQTQAESLARAWTPPRMLKFSDNPKCFICETKFAVFKRACHCRNCGVCVCSNCTTLWPSKCLPDTYNIKKEGMFNICKSCDWLSMSFRLALLNGNQDQAVALHATGNVNLVTPFANVKGELFYPVHCAVLGGNLDLLKWLVDEPNCCPTRSLRVSGRKESRVVPIVTSKGRSLLMLAMEKNKVEMVRYLVVDKNMPLAGESNLTMSTALKTLDSVLRLLPSHPSASQAEPSPSIPGEVDFEAEAMPIDVESFAASPMAPPEPFSHDDPILYSERNRTSPVPDAPPDSHDLAAMYAFACEDSVSAGTVNDACIICFANSIDCVIMPCGHQICCMECSANITPRKCPVCSVSCSFVRVYKP